MTTPILQFMNNASSTLASPISPTSTVIVLAAGDGQKFPNPVVGTQTFIVTLIDAATGGINEIVTCTARSVDTLTVIRAQEGTTAKSWIGGDSVKMLNTAGTQQAMIQIVQAQTGAYKYGADTGSVNSYVTSLSPPVTTRIQGMEVNVLAASNNTGPSTLNLGAGSIAIINPDGTPLGQGAIISGGVFTVIDTGSGGYQLISASQEAQSTTGQATTGDMKFRPTAETIAGWVVANGSSSIGNAASNANQLASATAANLFAWLWNNFSNTQCPVATSAGVPTTRGANAAADFAANKQILVLDLRGKAPMGVDYSGSNNYGLAPIISGNSGTPGSVLGENTHTLVVSELASHFHGASMSDPTHVHSSVLDSRVVAVQGSSTIGTVGSSAQQVTGIAWSMSFASTGVQVTSPNGTGNTYSQGGNAAHNNVPLAMMMTFYLKL